MKHFSPSYSFSFVQNGIEIPDNTPSILYILRKFDKISQELKSLIFRVKTIEKCDIESSVWL